MASTSTSTEIVVVGNGLFGSAAVRHLAQRGRSVVCIGAASSGPDVRATTESNWHEHRVYASHNDAGRLTRLQDRDAAWAEVTARGVAAYRALEAESGIAFYHDVGCLIVSRPGGDGINADPLDIMNETGTEYVMHETGDLAWQQRWPEISFPPTHYVAFEPAPAGWIAPKRMIEAQNVVASRAGAQFIEDTVINVERHAVEGSSIDASGTGHRVTTAGGLVVDAEQVLVAAGAFANFNGLLPEPVPTTLKSEVIVLGEVAPAAAEALARFPTVKYLCDPGDLEGIYMVPPIRYEDGRYYVKLGANTRLDQWMTELAEVQRWFNTDTDPDYLPIYEPVLRDLWPTVDFVSIRTQPCVITYTPDRFPLIDDLGGGLFVATAGNGGGAKGSDAWGADAAALMGAATG